MDTNKHESMSVFPVYWSLPPSCEFVLIRG